MREKVEMLKDHAHLFADFFDVLEVAGEFNPVDQNSPLLMFLEPVDAADQGRFSRAGRAADHDAFTPVNGQVDIVQDMQIAEPFMQAVNFNYLVFRRSAGFDRVVFHKIFPSFKLKWLAAS